MKLTKTFDLSNLMISISGVRGKIQSGFGLEEVLLFSNAFAQMVEGKTVVVGRDSRPSGEYIQNILFAALQSRNCNIISLGLVPTPTVKAVVNLSKAKAGVMLSASHNPMEWNAFKFIAEKGFFFSAKENQILLKNLEAQNFPLPAIHPKSKLQDGILYINQHLESVLNRVNVPKIKKKKFKVFLDAVGGAGSVLVPLLLERLGCEVVLHNCTPDGTFPRPPEPTPSALTSSFKAMKKTDADIGFALDPDADRLVLMSAKQGPISEELTLPLALLNLLPQCKKNSKIVINLSSSFVTEELASQYQAEVLRSKVGEANVVSKMIETKAIFGGEGNGGVIDPLIPSFGRDTLSGIAHILNLLAETDQSLEQLLNSLPKSFMEKKSFPLQKNQSLNVIYDKMRNEFSNAKVSEIDGLWLSEGQRWVHVRPSNTEPIFRVIGEAKTSKDLDQLMKRVKKCAE